MESELQPPWRCTIKQKEKLDRQYSANFRSFEIWLTLPHPPLPPFWIWKVMLQLFRNSFKVSNLSKSLQWFFLTIPDLPPPFCICSLKKSWPIWTKKSATKTWKWAVMSSPSLQNEVKYVSNRNCWKRDKKIQSSPPPSFSSPPLSEQPPFNQWIKFRIL